MNNNQYTVYIKTDDRGRITDINSSAFIHNPDGWVEVARGIGDMFHHAQGNFLPFSLCDERGIPRFTYDGKNIVQRDEYELDEDAKAIPHIPTNEERIDMLMDTIEGITKVLKALNIIK